MEKVIHPYERYVPLISEKVNVFTHTPPVTSLSGHLALFSFTFPLSLLVLSLTQDTSKHFNIHTDTPEY